MKHGDYIMSSSELPPYAFVNIGHVNTRSLLEQQLATFWSHTRTDAHRRSIDRLTIHLMASDDHIHVEHRPLCQIPSTTRDSTSSMQCHVLLFSA